MPINRLEAQELDLVINRNPLIVAPDTFLIDAIALMSQVAGSCILSGSTPLDTGSLDEVRASCVLVMEGQKLVGLFTERDVVRLAAAGMSLEGVKIASVMTRQPITLERSQFQDIFAVLKLFRQHRIRHLPIVNEQSHLVGLVTPTSVRQLLQPADLLRLRFVSEVMSPQVIHSPLTASVRHLAQLMAEYRVSCVVITKPSRENGIQPLGIVTERDIVQFQALELDFLNIQAHTVMSTPLFCLKPEHSLWDAHLEMQRRRVQRLVVTGEQGELIGIATQTSLLQALDPMEMYNVVNLLQQKVCQLEFEKVELLQNRNAELEKQVQERTAKLESAAAMLALAREREKAEAALRESEQKYRSVVNNVKEVIFQTDITGNWTFLNPAWTEITNFTVQDSIGTSFFNYIHSEDYQHSIELLQPLLECRKKCCRYEVRCLIKGGGFRWVEVYARLTLDGKENAIGTSGTLNDITERKQAEEDIRNALTKEKELNELKSSFVSMTSHEFRTPLTTILSSAELLQNYSHKMSEEKKLQHLGRIQASVKNMIHLLNDVLLIGKAEAGKLDFKPIPLNLVKFCYELVEEIELSTNTHTIVFCHQGDCTNACMDEKLLRHILSNLLSNAIKYSPSGTTVHFDLVGKEGEAIFRVQDSGIGIPVVDQAKLFDQFHRASNVGTISGTGLGLAIVKKSVDLHGGKIGIVSEVGVGTTFTLTIPLNQ